MKKLVLCSLLAAAFTVPGVALAQFSMPSLPGMGGSKSGGGAQADLSGQQASLVRYWSGRSMQQATRGQPAAIPQLSR